MNQTFAEKSCPRCGGRQLKMWSELGADEKILAEKMPFSAKWTFDERKRHRFCTNCWFEESRAAEAQT